MIFTVYLEIWVPASILHQGKEDRVVYISLFQKIKLFIFAPMWTSFWVSFLQNHLLVLFNFLSGNEYNLTSNLLFKYRGHHIRSGEGQYGRSKTFRAVNGTSRNFTMHGDMEKALSHFYTKVLSHFHTKGSMLRECFNMVSRHKIWMLVLKVYHRQVDVMIFAKSKIKSCKISRSPLDSSSLYGRWDTITQIKCHKNTEMKW